MSIITIDGQGYTENELVKNWAAAYAKRAVDDVRKEAAEHKGMTVLDHPDGSVTNPKLADGSVTLGKLDDEVMAAVDTKVEVAKAEAQKAQGAAAVADSKAVAAQGTADKALSELDDIYTAVCETADSVSLAQSAAETAADKAAEASQSAQLANANADGAQEAAYKAADSAAEAVAEAASIKADMDGKATLEYVNQQPGERFTNTLDSTDGITVSKAAKATANDGYVTVSTTTYSSNTKKDYAYIPLNNVSDTTTKLTVEFDMKIHDRRWWINICNGEARGYTAGESKGTTVDTSNVFVKCGTGAEYTYSINETTVKYDLRNVWVRSAFVLDFASKTFTYVLKYRDSGEVITSGSASFYDSDCELKPDSIELYTWNDNTMDIDNLSTIRIEDFPENKIEIIVSDCGMREMFGCKDGQVRRLSSNKVLQGVPVCVGTYFGDCPIWRMAIERELTAAEKSGGYVSFSDDIPTADLIGTTSGIPLGGYAHVTYSDGGLREGIVLKEIEPFYFTSGDTSLDEYAKVIGYVEFATARENLSKYDEA